MAVNDENRLSISVEGHGTYEVVVKDGVIKDVNYRTGGSRSKWQVAPSFGLLNLAVKYPKDFNEWIRAVRQRVREKK